MFSTTPATPHAGLAGHLGRAPRHRLGGRLRRGHEHQVGLRQQLAERDRDVAGAGRHVDHQVVELAPVDVGQELLERAVQHRPAPHDGGVVLGEEPDRHHLAGRGRPAARSSRRRPPAGGRCRACGGSSSRRCRRRSRPPRRRRPPARPPGSRSASTCRRRPCPTRPRSPGCARSSAIGFSPSRRRRRALQALRAAPCARSGVITSKRDADRRHAVDGADALAHLLLEVGLHRAAGHRQRDGHVDVAAATSTPRTMSSSTTLRRISGSITPTSASRIGRLGDHGAV